MALGSIGKDDIDVIRKEPRRPEQIELPLVAIMPIKTLCALAVTMSILATIAPGHAQQALPPVLERYQPVTAERLKNPEPGNWLMIRRTYDGWGYSPLDQITTQNVARLRPIWGFSTG